MNTVAVMKRIIQQFLRDKRSIALLVIAPMLVLTLIWLVLDGDSYHPKIGVADIPEPIQQQLQKELEKDIVEITEGEAKEAFEDGELDAFITFQNLEPSILIEGSDHTANREVVKHVQAALQSVQGNSNKVEPNIEFYYGSENLNVFDQVGAVLIGFFVFFFVFIIGGISFLRERTQGTLEKLLSTPIKRWEIVTGYLLGFGLFTIIQALIIVSFAIYVLDIWMAGEFWQLLIVTFLLAITALTLATLLSAFANNEFQIMQFIPIVIIPQVFFSGIFNLETLAEWIQILSKFMPLTYGANAMQEIMIKGKGIGDVWLDLLVLFGFAVVFYILNIIALKKHRRL
ncbi:ABC transporter permease [Salinibacillus xinjiangensis]|uniref:ABC transporter permease subunit n=1 Tax=Salinibacillus xinjiangensis TaxID=1229268 RepID=A0A6G1X918_9BACI|nr:ABC transporter permease [Salinibacillus xinjiangensis]MRG87437.1 ABC transporter permease subunit [Salinibacillus xinjiangensis]